MTTAITTVCRCCQLELELPVEVSILDCPACGTRNARPQSTGDTFKALRRATQQRLSCDFHNAVNSYQHVLLDCLDEHEALWGLALCRYSVEYVDDPRTGRRLPVVHGVRKQPMQLDRDFQQACDLAPEEVRAQYEAEAAYIDDAMAKIRELADACPPFDVFICHKTTKPGSSEYTEDYNRAFKLYHMLEKQGYRVFFAPMEMEGVSAGSDYEAGIYHALDTAKVMLVVCSDAEYLQSPWVRNEWMRFLEMADEGVEKRLVPLLYGGMAAGQLPREFRVRRLQAVTMGEMGASEIVAGIVSRYSTDRKPANAGPLPVAAPAPASVTAEMSAAAAMPAHAGNAAPADLTWNSLPNDFSIRTWGDCCSVSKYSGKDKIVNIPPVIHGKAVYEIGFRAFRGCTDVQRVTLPDGVKAVDGKAFEGCSELISVELPDSVERIGNSAFEGCASLKSIELPNGLKELACAAFKNCSGLTKAVLPEGLTTIERSTYQGCSSLAHVALPKTLRAIRSEAFAGCEQLSELWLPAGVDSIAADAFAGCNLLHLNTAENSAGHLFATEHQIPFVLRPPEAAVGQRQPPHKLFVMAYSPVIDFALQDVDGGCAVVKYVGNAENVNIPPVINQKRVVGVGSEAFRDCTGLKGVILPAGMEIIGEDAFAGCEGLRMASIPSSVTWIGNNAFGGCPRLTVFAKKDSEAWAHAQRYGISSRIPAEMNGPAFRELLAGFRQASELKPIRRPAAEIEIHPDPVRESGEKPETEPTPAKDLPYTPEAFFEVEPHEDGCMITGFTGDDSLRNLYIPPIIRGMKVLDIKEEAFVPKAEDKAVHFFDVVYLPETLNNLRGMSLDGLCCREFRTSDASESLLSARDGVLFIRDMLIRYPMESSRTSYTVPNGTKIIFNGAFDSVKTEEIKLPEGLQEICANAFWMSGVERMTLPRSLTKLGTQVFHGCLSLVLRVYRDSYAHQAVKEQGLRHEVLDASGHPVKEHIHYAPESDFTVEPYEDGWMIIGYTGKANDLLIPPTIKGKPVRMIGRYAFVANAEKGKLYEPERAIGILYLPATVQDVAGTSFQGISVGEFRVEESNPNLEARDGVLFFKSERMLLAYPHDKEASSYTVPAGTREIFPLAFCWCTNLREVILPDSLRKIGGNAFSDCVNLSSLQLPEGLEAVGGLAFSYCSSLTTLTIPRSVIDINERAFEECPAMLRVCRGSQAHAMLKNAKEMRAYELLGPNGQTLEKAKLVYIRKKKLLDSMLCHAIRVDRKITQTVSNGGQVTFGVSPGKHYVETYGLFGVLGNAVETPNWNNADSIYTRELQPGEVMEIVIPT